jgi:small-conductance mechanosensitive channel
MEMGQPPAVQSDHPPMWVRSRQYTGRIVTVTNDKIFDEPVYNYTRDFPYIWEEMSLPIGYTADRHRAETVILAAARKYAVPLNQLGEAALTEMERRYAVKRTAMGPRVYYRLTETWLELTVRFITRDHGIRETKDAMSREIMDGLEAAGIGVAAPRLELVGLPPVGAD